MNQKLKTFLPHITAVVLFIVLSAVYFSPVWEGYSLRQSDVKQFKGMAKEIVDYRLVNDAEPLWTNSMFSGMPAYQIAVKHDGNLLTKVDRILKLGLPQPVGMLFMMMLGFYIFALCLRINPWLGILGAIGFGFSTINVLYLGAGHITKVNAIAYMAPALGGMILAFRGKWLLGSLVFALFFGLNLTANHFQMTYYLVFLLFAVAVAETIRLIIAKEFSFLTRSIGGLVLGSLLAVAPSMSNLLTTYEYSKHTTRGASDLSIQPDGADRDPNGQNGLNKDYILEYNYGKGEILSIIAPNAKGAKDDYIGNDEDIMMNVDNKYAQQISQMNRYWGGQRMSGGAFYFGVIMVVFFIFGLFFLKDSLKWPMLALTILVLLLASKDPGGINDFFINKFPLYNKFRDSKMILVLLQVMIPALGVLFLDQLLKKDGLIGNKKTLLIGSGVLTFIGVVLFAFPDISGSFLRTEEMDQFADAIAGSQDPQQISYLEGLREALVNTRIEIYKSDVGRTLFLILVGCGLILLSAYTKISNAIVIAVTSIAVLADNMSLAKRYLNNEEDRGRYLSYEEADATGIPFRPENADMSILNAEAGQLPSFNEKQRTLKAKIAEDNEFYAGIEKNDDQEILAAFGALNLNTDYRVFNFANPFNETMTSYFHKSIGGYHGAKLKRYQEIIDFYIGPEMQIMNKEISAEKNKKLQLYAMTMPIAPDQAQAVFDTIQVGAVPFSDSVAILNMLNTKYVILDRSRPAVRNLNTNGEAWFVSSIRKVNSANEEMLALKGLNTKKEAVIHTGDFSSVAGKLKSTYAADSTSTIKLEKYGTNVLTYKSRSKAELPAVFSEIYYPDGWNCYIDGKEVETFRVNYILRAAMVPAGEHTIEWKFEPASFKTGSTVALISSILLLGALLGAGYMECKPKKA